MMNSRLCCFARTLCSLLILSLAVSGSFAAYEQVADPNELGFAEPDYNYSRSHGFDGDTLYIINEAIPGWLVKITKITDINGTPTPTTLVSNAAWMTFTNETYGNSLPGNRMKVVNGYLQFVEKTIDAVVRVNINTGAMSEFVSSSDTTTVTGNAEVNFTGESAFNPLDQSMAFFEEKSDNVLKVTADGVLSVFISKSELDAAMEAVYLNPVSGGITFDQEGNFYWTSSISGSNGNGGIYKRSTEGVFSKIMDNDTVVDMTPNSNYNQVAYNDIIAAPDGKLYFYDRRLDVDAIMCFYPDDPCSLSIFLSKDDLAAGPAGADNISSFDINGSYLTWNMIVPGLVYQQYLDAFPETEEEVFEMGYGLTGDLVPDTRIDIQDFAAFASSWYLCNDPQNDDCEENWLP